MIEISKDNVMDVIREWRDDMFFETCNYLYADSAYAKYMIRLGVLRRLGLLNHEDYADCIKRLHNS